MRKSLRPFLGFIPVVLIALVLGGCSAKAKKEGYLKKADQYFDAGQYDKAEIEYLNVRQIEPVNPQAISRLAVIFAEQGRIGQVMPFLLKAKQLQPDNLEVRTRLGMLYLSTGGTKPAAEEAGFILEHDPRNPDAPLILAESASKPEEIAAARERLKNLPAPSAESAPVLTALGTLELRENHAKEAEALFKRALAKDPKSSAAMAGMGTWYGMQKDIPQAEQAFKQASEWAASRSPRQLLYARLLMQDRKLEDARRSLESITEKTPDYLPAWYLQAEIAAAEKKFPESSTLIAKVLGVDPLNPDALLLSARVELAMGEKENAAAAMEKMVKAYPKSPQAYYQLGLVRYANNEPEAAIASLKQAVALAPRYAEAVLLLAEINLKKGETKQAVASLKTLAQQRPDVAQARFLLADAYRSQGNLPDALAVYLSLEQSLPLSPQAAYGKGVILLQQDKRDEARKAFNRTLKLAPDYLPALEQLIGFDLASKDYAAASRRVDDQIATNPKIAGPYLLRAKIELARKNSAAAEAALHKAIELQPDSPIAYLLLARHYSISKQQEKALANYKEATAKSPKNIEALMMTATLQNQLKDFAAARDSYEKVLAVNPKFFPALNDLAYLYGEHLDQLDKGQELAQKALEIVPHEPHAADTLGWILFKKRQYSWALTQLLESSAKMPDSAEVQFHLGLTQYMLGEADPARDALKRSLELDGNPPEKALIQDRLAVLAIDPKSAAAGAADKLENSLKERPDDPIALTKLAAIYAQSGALEKAIAAYQTALKASPKNLSAMLALSRLYAAHGENDQALDLAKNARKLANDDPEVTHLLSRLAYQTGDYAWALSLAQETNRKTPDNPAVLFDLAQAAYSVGRIADATDAMKHALADKNFPQANEARQFLAMTAIAAKPDSTDAEQVNKALNASPDYVPALMAKAAIAEQKADFATARDTYEKALAKFPDFIPAKRKLVIDAAGHPDDDKKTYNLAVSTKDALNDDADFTKAFGIVAYRTGEFKRATLLFRNAANLLPNDAETLYYLGMTQFQLKQTADSRQSLQRALDAKLKPELAAEARKTLAELK